MAERERELKSLLMKVKEKSEKVGSTFRKLTSWHLVPSDQISHSVVSHHFLANRWGNNGNTDRLFSWAPKSLQMVTAP